MWYLSCNPAQLLNFSLFFKSLRSFFFHAHEVLPIKLVSHSHPEICLARALSPSVCLSIRPLPPLATTSRFPSGRRNGKGQGNAYLALQHASPQANGVQPRFSQWERCVLHPGHGNAVEAARRAQGVRQEYRRSRSQGARGEHTLSTAKNMFRCLDILGKDDEDV